MNTQKGNNNPYNQDNEITWLNWDLLEKNRDMFRFFQRMIAFRKAHPSIARSHFWRDDISWYGTGTDVDFSPQGQTLAYCLHGQRLGDGDIYVMINANHRDHLFHIQEGTPAGWKLVVDTSRPSPQDIADPGKEPVLTSLDYLVKGRSLVVLTK